MKVDSAFWRRLAFIGARHGPTTFVRYSPTFFGLVFAALLPEQRQQVRHNLRQTLGRRASLTEERDVYRTFSEFAHCLAESLGAEREDGRNALVRVVGREHLEAVLGSREGAIVVTAHTGAWDAAARLLRRDYGVDVMVVMARERDQRARGLHDEIRSRAGVQVAHVGSHPVDALPLGRHLRQGGFVAIQLDRVQNGAPSITVPFFGGVFQVPLGPFQLAAVSGAPILPIFTRRLGFFRYEVNILPSRRICRGARRQERERCALDTAEEMHRFIRANPTQWFHFAV